MRAYEASSPHVATLFALLLLGACAPAVRVPPPAPEPAPAVGLPPVPRVEGPLQIQVVHPTPQVARPGVDSTFIYGSVGHGGATLRINGMPVEVAPNGAFIGYLPVPANGAYELVAEAGGARATDTVTYRVPATSGGGAATPPLATVELAPPRQATVTGGADTLTTGSDVAIGRTAPAGTYRWFLPRGARLLVTAQRGDMVRAQLDSATTAWLPAASVALADSGAPEPRPIRRLALRPAPDWVDVRVELERVPFLVEASDSLVTLTMYGADAPTVPPEGGDPLIAGSAWSRPRPGTTMLRLRLQHPLWGYKAFYDADGSLVLRLRRPPRLDPADPLRGLRIVVDPGHPPAGATGPTGLTEAEANLAIGIPLAEMLRARGAEVVLTRTDNTPVPLEARVRMATSRDAHLLVSVHNNAFGEGANPFRANGTSTYYFHPLSAGLARALDREIAAVTRIPDLGARQGNLALVRTPWVPSTLTESLYMPMPEQEAALRDPAFVRRLAEAHVRGIEAFLRAALAPRPAPSGAAPGGGGG